MLEVVIRCQHCANEVPALAFCVICGNALADAGRLTAAGRDRFSAAPDEPARAVRLRPSLAGPSSAGQQLDLATNLLYYDDNLDILRRYLPDASVDLVYLDRHVPQRDVPQQVPVLGLEIVEVDGKSMWL